MEYTHTHIQKRINQGPFGFLEGLYGLLLKKEKNGCCQLQTYTIQIDGRFPFQFVFFFLHSSYLVLSVYVSK